MLAANGGSGERRNQLTHPAYTKPELLAIALNQVWSWDITKLKGPAKWTCFHLYVARQLPKAWQLRYRYRPVLFETFVETQRHHGTCYKAANWVHIGPTTG